MSKLTEAHFKKLLKDKAFSGIYMIYGDEKYSVKRYTEDLIKKIAGEDPDDFCFHVFKDFSNPDAISSACDIIPFMADYNCVWLKDIDTDELFKNLTSDTGKGKEITEKFLEILSKANGETIIIISQPTVTPKATGIQKKIIDYADKHGNVLYIKKKTDQELVDFITKASSKYECKISGANAQKIIQRCGNDLNTITNETDKLFSFAYGREVTEKDISMIVTPNTEYNIFKLSENIMYGNAENAYKILDDMFYQKQPPEIILSLITKSYCDIYRVKSAIRSSVSVSDLLGKFDYTGNKSFLLDKAERNGRNLSLQKLRKMLDMIFEAERKIKSTATDNRVVLETLISELISA